MKRHPGLPGGEPGGAASAQLPNCQVASQAAHQAQANEELGHRHRVVVAARGERDAGLSDMGGAESQANDKAGGDQRVQERAGGLTTKRAVT